MKVPTDWYEIELEDQYGNRILHQVYTTEGFLEAEILAKKEMEDQYGKDYKVIQITRILRDASLLECMVGGQK